jgi:hypothetical protein
MKYISKENSHYLKSSAATRHGGAWGERRYSSYSFTTSALDGGEWRICQSDFCIHYSPNWNNFVENSGSHGDGYEDGCLYAILYPWTCNYILRLFSRFHLYQKELISYVRFQCRVCRKELIIQCDMYIWCKSGRTMPPVTVESLKYSRTRL